MQNAFARGLQSAEKGDPLRGKISDESPIGQALLGKKVGDAAELKTAIGTHIYKVVAIS